MRTADRSLYMQAPPPLEEATRPNLDRRMTELVADGTELVVTDATLPISLQLVITYV